MFVEADESFNKCKKKYKVLSILRLEEDCWAASHEAGDGPAGDCV